MPKRMNCRTCLHLDVPADARGRRALRDYSMHWCNAPLPQLPAIPDSARPPGWMGIKLERGMTCASYGEECPAWTPLENAKTQPQDEPEAGGRG
jgi:hypothetical protein